MQGLFRFGELDDIARKVDAGERLTHSDGERLLQSADLLSVGMMADLVRRRKHGSRAYFIINRHINHTNVCVNRCKLCAFGRDEGDPGAYTMALEEVERKAMEYRGRGITEIHIVGGLNEKLGIDYYVEMLKRVRGALPGVKIQSFTAVEVDYLARSHNMPVDQVIRELMKAGLDSLPGGGAEVFSPRVRDLICPPFR